ncbi:MAG TPA: exodeoxyribonuclease V subunit alpha [Smithella sp.]|nr:exodeoxyribonuclease V subunit alpha [Smithella sp.]
MLAAEKMDSFLNNYFSPMDIHFGEFISSFGREKSEALFLAAALVGRCVREGHIFLNLNDYAGQIIWTSEDGKNIIECPPLPSWLASLRSSPCVGAPGDFKPLILNENGRLYLQRYWQYEKDVAQYLFQSISGNHELISNQSDQAEFQKKLRLYFNEKSEGKTDWQKVAAAAAMLKKFLVISGSPGTGKTTAITKIMALMLDAGGRPMRIALTAPTGKAAARLQESVNKMKEKLNCSASIKDMIPGAAQTIHRLLGSISYSPYFRFNRKNHLPYELVVIDEASMVDLPLLAKLIAALPSAARLILLGDKDQLASVEAGVVLGDISSLGASGAYSPEFVRQIAYLSGEEIESGKLSAGIQDHIIYLQKNYRFPENSGIGLLSQNVKNGKSHESLEVLRAGKYKDIHWTEITESAGLWKHFGEGVVENYRPYLEAAISGEAAPETIFNIFEKFRILCALRVGIWGTERINLYVEKVLRDAGLIQSRDFFYEGMPVMILQNDYRSRLFNGDVGIILKDPEENNQLRVFFRDEQNAVRKYLPSALPQYETAWAMTVHKSQGSEFKKVLLVLSGRDVPFITRELIYTGITRASDNVDIWAGEDLLTKAIARRISRQSGLTDALAKVLKC